MEIQAKKYPDETVPVVVTSLAQAILNNNGAKTEGIFRVHSLHMPVLLFYSLLV